MRPLHLEVEDSTLTSATHITIHQSFYFIRDENFLGFGERQEASRLLLNWVSLESREGRGEREREKMLEGKALIEDTDMPKKMQIQAMAAASQALDLYDVFDCTAVAAHIKKEFDKRYGGGWQCVVGSNFGCFFTHKKGTFIYFTLETLNFLIFKGAVSST
ncbi:hypothetical protein Ancab_012198 [Ancistrocladus abbreviatus]